MLRLAATLAIVICILVVLSSYWTGAPLGYTAQEPPEVESSESIHAKVMVSSTSQDEETVEPHDSTRLRTELQKSPDPSLDLITVRVVDATTKQAIAGAEVLCPPNRSARELGRKQAATFEKLIVAHQFESLFRQFGSTYKCDSKGECEIPRPVAIPVATETPLMRSFLPPYPLIIAVHGSQYGDLRVKEVISSSLQIETTEDVNATVLVLDARGLPAPGVNVIVQSEAMGRALGLMSSSRTSKTDKDGRAELEHLQTQVITRPQKSSVRIAGLGIDAEKVSFDIETPPVDPIILRLPPTGSIEVTVIEGGKPLADGDGSIQLVVDPEPKAWYHVEPIPIKDGRVTIHQVSLGKPLRLCLLIAGKVVDSQDIPALQHQDEVVQRVFELTNIPRLNVDVIDSEGNPLAETYLTFVLDFEGVTKRIKTASNTRGTVRLGLDHETANTALRSLRIETTSHWPKTFGGMSSRKIEVGQVLVGRYELGTVTLADMPLLVSGRVIDDSGAIAPLSWLRTYSTEAEKRELGLGYRRVGESGFEIRGKTEETEIAIQVGYQLWTQTIICQKGQADVVFVFQRKGSIMATLDHAGNDPLHVIMSLEPEAGGDPIFTSRYFHTKVKAGTRFSWSDLAIGRYRLRGRLLGDGNPFCLIEGIEIGPGKNQDPRLDSIRATDLAIIQLELTDSRGLPIEKRLEGIIFVRRSATKKDWEGSVISNQSKPSLAVPSGLHDIRVCIAGYQTVQVDGVQAGRTTIVLVPRKAFTVQLEIDGDLQEDVTVFAHAKRIRTGATRFTDYSGQRDSLDADGFPDWTEMKPGIPTELHLPGPGEYELLISAIQQTGLFLPPEFNASLLRGQSPRRFTFSREAQMSPQVIRIPASKLR